MKISKIELINFKRFTHLVIDEIPGDAKLVLLIGSNGSGKSSVFDGLDYLSKTQLKRSPDYEKIEKLNYYRKNLDNQFELNPTCSKSSYFQLIFMLFGCYFFYNPCW